MTKLEWSRAPQPGIAIGDISFTGTLSQSDLAKCTLSPAERAVIVRPIETAADMLEALAVAYRAIQRKRGDAHGE